MESKNTVGYMALKSAASLLAHAGPGLARVGLLRNAAVHIAEREILEGLLQSYHGSDLPPGVNEDRTWMALALLRTIERAIAEDRLAPAVVRKMVRNLAYNVLIAQGDQSAVRRFGAEYGTRPPSFMVISPGKACNLHCEGCYADSGSNAEKLEWRVLDRVLCEAKTLWGVRFFVISGGEPLAYRAQGKGILDAAEKHDDCFFMMYTNGKLIDDGLAGRLAELGNLTPAISVEGWRERTDARRGEGVFQQVLSAMSSLRAAGVPFGISLTATRDNVTEILSDAFMDFAFAQQRALYGWLFHYMPIGRSYTLELMPTAEQRLWMWRRSWEIIRQRQILLADFWNHGTASEGCIAAGRSNGGGYLHVDWNGAVTPCVFVPYSPVNVNEIYAEGGTLNDVWAHAFFAGIREWQAEYRNEKSEHGNWLRPCLIRDHHAAFRGLASRHQPQPSDVNACEALRDPAYTAGMIAYDAAYAELADPVWTQRYLRPEGSQERGAQPSTVEQAREKSRQVPSLSALRSSSSSN